MQYRINYQRIFLAGLALFFLGMVVWVRMRLLSLPLERDEGEYAYMAQQLLQGILPYTETQSMKFPGIYFVYAGVIQVFGESPSSIHFSLLIVNLATAFLVFLLGKKLLNPSSGIFAAACFSVLTLSSSIQGVWANSEHFVLLPAIGGILFLWKAQDQSTHYLFSGFLLGCSLLIKQHAVFFCLFGALYLIFRICNKSTPFQNPIKYLSLFFLGGMAPLIITALLYGVSGKFSQFWFCTVQYASEYVSLTSLGEGFANFKYNFAQIVESNFPILWLALIGLASVAWIKDRKHEFIFLFGFFACSFLAITPGLYFRPHYFLLWMPAISLLAGAGFDGLTDKLPSSGIKNWTRVGILVLALGIPFLMQKELFFKLSPFQVTRLVYGLNPFSESLEVAKYIREHSENNSKVAVLGSEPQIYFFAQRRAATRHIYMYPLMEPHVYARQMQAELIREVEKSEAEFVVVANLAGSWVSSRPDISPMLIDWAKVYLNDNYEIKGVADIISNDETIYKWDGEAIGYYPQSRYHLLIYKKRI